MGMDFPPVDCVLCGQLQVNLWCCVIKSLPLQNHILLGVKIKSVSLDLCEVELRKLGLYYNYITSYCDNVHFKALQEPKKLLDLISF